MYQSYIRLFLLSSSLLSSSWASLLANTKSRSFKKRADAPPSTTCGDIVTSGEQYFTAKVVYDCLTSVPFNPDVGKSFIKYYNDSIQFQSTLEILKSPPLGYQQPAVDVVGHLNQMIIDIDNNVYKNQYDFESTLQAIVYSMHDEHVSLKAGILGTFSFGVDWTYEIVSLSLDGIQLPKVYFTSDLEDSEYDGDWTPSAISKINDQDVILYLTGFAARQSAGSLERHSEFNQLMASPAQDIQGYVSVWTGGATFYPGDSLTFVLENGTQIYTSWYAQYHSPGPTGPLQTGADFYNFFVLGLYPQSYDPYQNFTPNAAGTGTNPAGAIASASPSLLTRRQTTDSDDNDNDGGDFDDDDDDDDDSGNDNDDDFATWDNVAYPYFPDIAQKDLGTFGGGSVSGYFFDEFAVLSIPSFVETGRAVGTLSQTIADFITQSKLVGMKKVVIDLQQNWGGDAFFAFDTFRQFFPNIEPYGGSRLRATSPIDVMGDTITGYWEGINETNKDYSNLYTSEWTSGTRLNASTGQNFSSWAEFFGPTQESDDYFTSTQQFNFSDVLFDTLSVPSNDDFIVHGYGASVKTAQPYAAEDIIILSDSLCSSTCAIFMEMMQHEAGVKTVVVGGLPVYGAMQAPGLTRGARSYGITDQLDSDIAYAQSLLQDVNDPNQNFLPNRTEALNVFVNYASLNLRDQIRKDSDIPLQFIYQPADCRIFFTPDTWNNYTALWQYAADAIWNTPSLCVSNSTNQTPSNPATATSLFLPAVPAPTIVPPQSSSFAETIMRLGFGPPPAPEAEPITACLGQCTARSNEGTACNKDMECVAGYFCLETYQVCSKDPDNPGLITVPTCFLECDVNSEGCQNNANCQAFNRENQHQLAAINNYDNGDEKQLAALESDIQSLTSKLFGPPRLIGAAATTLQAQINQKKRQVRNIQRAVPGYCHPPPPPKKC